MRIIQQMKDKRNHRVKVDYGMNDYFNFYDRVYKKDIPRRTYSELITEFNHEVRQMIIRENLKYSFPYLHFQLILKKDRRKPTIKNGKLINNIPVNWKATKALWERDKEAKEKKLLVRYNNSHTSGYVFRIYFKKFNSNLKAKSVYKFNVNRAFKREVKDFINHPDSEVDAFLLYKNNYHV